MSADDPLVPGARKTLGTLRANDALISPDVREFFQRMQGQMLLTLVRKTGVAGPDGLELRLPAADVDGNGRWLLSLRSDGDTLVLIAKQKP